MADFILPFDPSSFERLDQLGLLTCQDYNLGNSNDWFGSFRGGLHGVYSRINAVYKHYYEVHAWIPAPRTPGEVEYHLAAIFFNMDSAIECMTFALNAFGNSIASADFRNVTNERSLRRISPQDILGDPGRTPAIAPLPGYAKFFPTLQAHWQNNCALIQQIVDQHDVSKHRETIFEGGRVRNDAPPGFYEALGITREDPRRWQFQPMGEIILHPKPKSPKVTRVPTPVAEQIHLEPMATSFCQFINESSRYCLSDVESTIPLTHRAFK